MIKGKPSFPFHTIALAVAFNSELDFLVSEMRRYCDSHACMAVFIHAGKKTGENFRTLSSILTAHGFHDGNSRIYWEQGKASSAILQICKHEVVDLLILGLSEKSNFDLPAGSLTLEICQKAKCSVLVYSGRNSEMNKIVVDANDHRKTDHALMTALYFSERSKSKEMIVLDQSEKYFKLSVSQGSENGEEEQDSALVHAIERSGVDLTVVPVKSNDSFELMDYVVQNKADLLVINSVDHHLKIFDRITTDQIGQLLSTLQCNLLIVHSRLKEEE